MIVTMSFVESIDACGRGDQIALEGGSLCPKGQLGGAMPDLYLL